MIAADLGVREDPNTGDEPINVDRGLTGPTLGPPLIAFGLVIT